MIIGTMPAWQSIRAVERLYGALAVTTDLCARDDIRAVIGWIMAASTGDVEVEPAHTTQSQDAA